MMTGKMFTMAALGALAAATPALAQWNGSVVDTQGLRGQIEDGVARGDLPPRKPPISARNCAGSSTCSANIRRTV